MEEPANCLIPQLWLIYMPRLLLLENHYSGSAGEPESENARHFFSPKWGSWSQSFYGWTEETGDESSLFVSAVFCEEFFGKNRALYVDVTCIQRCRSFSEGVGPRIIVLESQPGEQNSRSKRSREITNEAIAV